MSLGDSLRRMIDPTEPSVQAWLRRELPRLVAEQVLLLPQAEAIAARYGVTLDTSAMTAPAQAPAEPPPQPSGAPPGPGGTPPPWQDGAAVPTQPLGPGVASRPVGPGVPPQPGGAPAPVPGQASSPFFAEHAVSIVLYLGAFLVVSAVVIFLAYSWGDMSAGAKLAWLVAFTTGFLGLAAICLPRPAVRPAGRTFLAIGAILVPANVAALYFVYFENTPVPGAVFWLLGSVISGALHAALSLRLGSRAYAVLAVLAVPSAAYALAWLIVDKGNWLPPVGALALIATLAAARVRPTLPLAEVARWLSGVLLGCQALFGLPFLSDPPPGQYAASITILLVSAGLAVQALRGGTSWWLGAAGALLFTPAVAIVLAVDDDHLHFVLAVMATCWIAALTARRLPRSQAVLWDIAALGPALVFPFAAWGDDPASVLLFANVVGLSALLGWIWRSPLPLYASALAIDGGYVKLLDIYGNPNSPEWMRGVSLWPLALVWSVLVAVLPRRFVGPCCVAAALPYLAASAFAWDRHDWSAGITLTAGLTTILLAWRLSLGPILLLAAPWLFLWGYHAAEAIGWAVSWRFTIAGLAAWVLFAISLVRPPTRPQPAAEATPETPEPVASAQTTPTEPAALDLSQSGAARAPTLAVARRKVQSQPFEWPLSARISGVAVAVVAALIVPLLLDTRDGSLWAATVSSANVALFLAAWACLTRSKPLGLVAALAVTPVILWQIARFEPANGQAYAGPVGGYLLAVAWGARVLLARRAHWAASAIAGVALLILLGTSVVQSLDRNRFEYVLLALVESLLALGVGIAVRWRVLVIAGVAGTVLASLRQLFDAVAALPGWAILGGSGMLLLGIAVVLLLARARLAAAGRATAERWSTWD